MTWKDFVKMDKSRWSITGVLLEVGERRISPPVKKEKIITKLLEKYFFTVNYSLFTN